MDFDRYPIDNQTCRFEFYPFGYGSKEITADFLRDEESGQALRPKFSKANLDYNADFVFDDSMLFLRRGDSKNAIYSFTGFNITLKRKQYKYICTQIVPTAILVVISWVRYFFAY